MLSLALEIKHKLQTFSSKAKCLPNLKLSVPVYKQALSWVLATHTFSLSSLFNLHSPVSTLPWAIHISLSFCLTIHNSSPISILYKTHFSSVILDFPPLDITCFPTSESVLLYKLIFVLFRWWNLRTGKDFEGLTPIHYKNTFWNIPGQLQPTSSWPEELPDRSTYALSV